MPRPPVVTIMGHVDHGKTSLLDALRSTDVAAGEAGGITQHIGAYQVTLPGGEHITFIDTPGHEAFTAMRARGASVTDIVMLVVPPMMASCRRPSRRSATPRRRARRSSSPSTRWTSRTPIRTGCARNCCSHEVVVEEMGGETQDVEVSALKRTGLDKLVEAILLQSEILDLKANPNRSAEGTVIESRLDRGRGPIATVLVQKGTLHQGEIVVAGAEWGRVRAMLDDKGRPLAEAGPSVPVEILGLAGMPSAGEPFVVVEDEGRAREITEFRAARLRDKAAGVSAVARGTLDQMLARIQAGVQKEVAILIKADVQGSAEAIQATVLKQATMRCGSACCWPASGRSPRAMSSWPRRRGGDRRVQRARHIAGARVGAARGRRYPVLLDHLRGRGRYREAGQGQDRAQGAREVPRLRGNPAGVRHHQGRQGGRLHGDRRLGETRRRRARAARQRGDPYRRADRS